MENKNYGVWGGVIIGVIVIVLALMYLVKSPTPPTPGSLTLPPVTASDWQKGQAGTSTPPLTLVEYSDFQCPACAVYYGLVKKLEAEYSTSTLFVYRHFPLPQHLDAKEAAYATEAAGKQGKFFEMHDILFEKQSEWGVDTHILPTDPTEITPAMKAVLEPKLISYAQTLGLDMAKFKADMASKEIHDKIDQAILDGRAMGIPATPTFFLNGKQLENPNGYEDFKKIFDESLKKS